MATKLHTARVHAAISALQRVTELFHARRVELARRVGLTEQQWRVLESICAEHFIPSMFAKSRESSAAAVSKILRQLLDKGLIAASICQEDGRQRNYELTSAGRRTMRELGRQRQAAIDHVWMSFRADTVTQFTGTANDISDAIEAFRTRESVHG